MIVWHCLGWGCTVALVTAGSPLVFSARNASFYVDATNGDDAYSGRLAEPDSRHADGPLRTIQAAYEKLQPGDCLYVKKGIYREAIILNKPATDSRPIAIRPYPGDEGKVIVTGAEKMLDWKPCPSQAACAGNPDWANIFYADVSGEVAQLFQDAVRLHPSRYPNRGWSYPTSTDAGRPTTVFFDAGLRQQDIDFVGAVCNVKTALWQINQIRVGAYSREKGRVQLESPTRYPVSPSFGYYFTHVVGEINEEGEWAYDGAHKRIYLWPVGKSLENVEATMRQNGIYSESPCSYHTITGLVVIRAIDAICLNQSRHMTIQGNTIEYAYDSGIVDAEGSYNRIIDNTIRYSHHTGITDNGASSYDLIQGNTVYATGAENVGDDVVNDIPNGMFIGGSQIRLINNRIDRCGYAGIFLSGNTSNREIAYNYITRCCLSLADGGGIYTGGPSGSDQEDIFHHNIIDDVGGWLGGVATVQSQCAKAPGLCRGEAHGIYLDEQGNHTLFEYNTVMNCGATGMFFHWTQDNRLSHNTLYNNAQSQLLFSGKDDPRFLLRNNTATQNLLIAKAGQNTFQLNLDYTGFDFGTSDENHFYQGGAAKHIVVCQDLGGGPCTAYSLADWHQVSGQDAHSQDLSVSANKTTGDAPVIFINPSMMALTIDLEGVRYVDANHHLVEGTVSIDPFESVVLFSYADATDVSAGR
jgi:parallel beta-helix repeat protein